MSIDYVVDDLVVKEKLTDKEEIELLERAIIGGYSGSEWKYYQPHYKRIFNKYVDNLDKVKKLETRIENLEEKNKENKEKITELAKKIEEINAIKKENIRLKIISGEAESGWTKELDWIYRPDPETGKPEGYRCPFNFKHKDVKGLTIHFHKYKEEKWADFEHPYPGYSHLKSFDMPHTAYLWLKGELPEQKKKSKLNIHDIKNDIDAKNYIKSIGGNTKGKYITRVLRFLIKRRGDTFDIQEFDDDCGFKGQRESRRQYIKKLISWGFIQETRTQGIYRIIF